MGQWRLICCPLEIGARWTTGTGRIGGARVTELEKFDEAASAIVVPYLESLNTVPPPERIFHYTNGAGLRGILQSGAVWLTHISGLNDPSELAHGLSHAIDALRTRARTLGSASESFLRALTDFVDRGGLQKSIRIHVCSFSAEGDDLSQWRAYGDDGLGFSLGFEAATLETAFGWPGGEKSERRGSFPMCYDEARLRALNKKIVDQMANLVDLPLKRKVRQEDANEFWRELSVLLTLHSLHLATVFKHKAYASEREYRFMQFQAIGSPIEGLKHRVRGYETIPYIEFDWRAEASNSLRHITIGPAADESRASEFIYRCVEEFKIQPVPTISRSSIPYRSARIRE
jgi:hypothetical protein